MKLIFKSIMIRIENPYKDIYIIYPDLNTHFGKGYYKWITKRVGQLGRNYETNKTTSCNK